MKNFALILFSAVMFVSSCNKQVAKIGTELDEVESYISERPQDALMALASLDMSSLRKKSVKHRYELLLAQAKDKCGIDEINDSTMRCVVDYYHNRNNPHYLFNAYYYLGRILENAGKEIDAMQYFLYAEQLLDHIEDNYQKGLLYAHFGRLYQSQLDYTSARKSYEKAFMYYEICDAETQSYCALLDIANMNYGLKNYSDAVIQSEQAMSWAYQNSNHHIYSLAVDNLCLIYRSIGDYEKLHELLQDASLKVNYSSVIRHVSCASDCLMRGDIKSACTSIELACQVAKTITDTASIYHMQYELHKLAGNYSAALYSHERLLECQDSIVRISLQRPLGEIRAEYYGSLAEHNSLMRKNERMRWCLILSVVIIVSLLTVTLLWIRIIKKKEELEMYLELADDLDYGLRVRNDNLAALCSALFSRQYALLDKLSKAYYENPEMSNAKNAVFQQVKREFEMLASDKNTAVELESMVNLHKGNVMKLIRNEFPQLAEHDYKLICFFFIGFSAKAISVFTGESVNNIYVRKTRLKMKLNAIGTSEASTILQYLSLVSR